jgi:hypothetical protein
MPEDCVERGSSTDYQPIIVISTVDGRGGAIPSSSFRSAKSSRSKDRGGD